MSLMYRGVSTPEERSFARLGDVLWAFVLMIAVATILVASRPATATDGSVLSLADESGQFAIAPSDVIALRVAPIPQGRARMHILLSAEAASDLSSFTRERRGDTMVLYARGEVLGELRIDSSLDGGYLGVTFPNAVRATRVARLVGHHLL